VYNADIRGDRSLTLRYIPQNNIPLAKSSKEVLKHLHRLWGFPVILEVDEDDNVPYVLERCPTE